MRVVARVGDALFLLLFVAVIGLRVVLPRVAGEDVVRARLSEATKPAIGRGVEFTALKFELFPPSVIVIGAVVGDEAMPLARADRIELTLAFAPLLAGILLIDSVIIEGAEIHLVRTQSGIAFVGAETAESNRAVRSDLAVRGLSLSGAEITLEDRTVHPALLWVLRDVAVRVFAEALGSPIVFDLAGEFASGGQLFGNGEVGVDGELKLELGFEAVAIATARPYFAADYEVGGLLTGSIRANGSVDSPAIELTATLREASLQLGDIALRGTLEIDASIRDALGAPNGFVELDATEAELRYAGFFTKAPGSPARVVGQVTTSAEGALAMDAWEFVMQDLDGHVQVEADDRFRLAGPEA